ncbi:shikimate dehydrogenase [Colwellia asteriadis]|uniref:Shikimate dehydrogenase (NADP(+)) n=1 Tax=Colwellia asteriadis TaxID=517723 RepID=A0ABN1L899_9GAMM
MEPSNLDKYCVFGNPIAQSRSPFIHHAFAVATNKKISYQAKFVELGEFTSAIQTFIKEGGKGANVTAPFKEEALRIADHLTERARLAGAVNTLTIKDGKIYGDNTDGEGLVQDLIRNNIILENSRILLLGAGGAAKGVILPLLSQSPKSITIANRTLSKASELCQQFNNDKLFSCELTEESAQPFDIIINATSASLSGQTFTLSSSIIASHTACYDMVYGKAKTPFILWAEKHSANKKLDGLGMLVGQAAESFQLWHSTKPEVDPVINKLRQSLKSES